MMDWKGLTDKDDRRFVKKVFGAVVAGWLLIAALPAIALWTSLFPIKTKEEIEIIESVLRQFGTYGDMFGLLNCLFSGLALIGVAYAIVLQSRDLHNQQRESKLQNRLTAYQSLADHHRDRRDSAGDDKVLKAQCRGREIAYAEMMKAVLREIEGRQATNPFSDHADNIRNRRNQYQEYRHMLDDPQGVFDPVEEPLLGLVEEIAALTELVRDNADAERLLRASDQAANRAVNPEPAMDRPEADLPEIRAFQLAQADLAFQQAIEAARVLGCAP